MNHLASHSTNTSGVGGDEFNSSWVGPHVKAHWDYGYGPKNSQRTLLLPWNLWEKYMKKVRRLSWAMCHILTHSLDIGKPIYFHNLLTNNTHILHDGR